MPHAVVQVAYDSLQDIAKRFMVQAETIQEVHAQITRTFHDLEPDWIGAGAEAFFGVMHSATLPAFQRLIAVLQDGHQLTSDVASLFRTAEEEAANVFQDSNASVSTPVTVAGSSVADAVAEGGMGYAATETAASGGSGTPAAGGGTAAATATITNQLNSILNTQPLDKEALMKLVQQASPADKAAIIKDRALMQRLRDELKRKELKNLGQELANVPGIPEGNIRKAYGKLAVSENDVEANTAIIAIKGKVTIHTPSNLKLHPDEANLLKANNLNSADFDIYEHPTDPTRSIAVRKAGGASAIIGEPHIIINPKSSNLTDEIVHETNHTLDVGTNPSNALDRFKSEFKAFYTEGMAEKETDPVKRAEKIRKYVLSNYPDIQKAVKNDPALKAQIEQITMPTGNIDNRE